MAYFVTNQWHAICQRQFRDIFIDTGQLETPCPKFCAGNAEGIFDFLLFTVGRMTLRSEILLRIHIDQYCVIHLLVRSLLGNIPFLLIN